MSFSAVEERRISQLVEEQERGAIYLSDENAPPWLPAAADEPKTQTSWWTIMAPCATAMRRVYMSVDAPQRLQRLNALSAADGELVRTYTLYDDDDDDDDDSADSWRRDLTAMGRRYPSEDAYDAESAAILRLMDAWGPLTDAERQATQAYFSVVWQAIGAASTANVPSSPTAYSSEMLTRSFT